MVVLSLSAVAGLVAVSSEGRLLIYIGMLASFDLVCCKLFEISNAGLESLDTLFLSVVITRLTLLRRLGSISKGGVQV
jgi:hypothetical protein